jgi:uncharacterized membrane protein
MMRFGPNYVAGTVLLASFLLPAYFYGSLPDKIAIARGFFGGPEIFADKSPFTVLRVPIIDTICALAFLLMGRATLKGARPAALIKACGSLIGAAAFKSLYQSLELVSGPGLADGFFYLTVAAVAAGIIAAGVFVMPLKPPAGLRGLRLGAPEKIGLMILLILYVAVAFVPALHFGGV